MAERAVHSARDKACFTVLDEPEKEPGYDTETDILRNGPRAEILAFTIEHISGKAVREK